MKETIEDIRRAAAALTAASRAMGKVQDLARAERPAFFEMQEACEAALKALQKVPPVDARVQEALRQVQERLSQASAHLERERALLAGRIATALQEAGLAVRGQLPLLGAGPFTLEFVQGRKPRCVVWLGPRQEKVEECPMEPEAIVQAVKAADESLFGGGLDEESVLGEMREAYRVACLRRRLPEGERVPLTALMAEMAFQRQEAAFRADPIREHFRPFGRLHFGCLLGRLRHRRIGEWEMRLDTATMAQTRRAEDHLWVPRGRSGDGTHCATVAFVKVRKEDLPS